MTLAAPTDPGEPTATPISRVQHHRGVIAGIAAYSLWGGLTVYWHALGDQPPLELIGQRVVWSCVLLVAVTAATRQLSALAAAFRNPVVVGRCAVAGVLLSANWTAYVWAVTHDNVVETALGYFMAPLGTVAIGVLAFGERLRRAQAVAIGLAIAAVVVLSVGNGRPPGIAILLAVTWALYGWLKRTIGLSSLTSLTCETLLLLPAAVVLVFAYEQSSRGVFTYASGPTIALVVLSGAVTTAPLLLFAHAAPRVRFTILGPLQYLVPTINFALGVGLYHESVPAWRVAGFLLVISALAITTLDVVRSSGSSVARE